MGRSLGSCRPAARSTVKKQPSRREFLWRGSQEAEQKPVLDGAGESGQEASGTDLRYPVDAASCAAVILLSRWITGGGGG